MTKKDTYRRFEIHSRRVKYLVYEGSPTNQLVHVDLNYCLTDGLGKSRLKPDHGIIT